MIKIVNLNYFYAGNINKLVKSLHTTLLLDENLCYNLVAIPDKFVATMFNINLCYNLNALSGKCIATICNIKLW